MEEKVQSDAGGSTGLKFSMWWWEVTLEIETKGVSHKDMWWRSLETEKPASAIGL